MNTKEKIAIMQAYLEGKPVQVRLPGGGWLQQGDAEPAWAWDSLEYRLAPPEPRRIWVKEFVRGELGSIVWLAKPSLDPSSDAIGVVEFVEVIKEER